MRSVQYINKAQLIKNLNIKSPLNSLDKMHKNVGDSLAVNRRKAVERHNAKTHVVPYRPIVGDYVVVARTQGPRTKMSNNWVGPRRVSRILSDFTVEVEHLLTDTKAIIHICRIKPYADSLVGTPVQMKEVAANTDRIWYAVERIKDIRELGGHFEVLVSWKGFSSAADSWEPLIIMFEDVPVKVREFFKARRKTSLLQRAMSSTGI